MFKYLLIRIKDKKRLNRMQKKLKTMKGALEKCYKPK
mgnify:CR=1 FL=1